MPEQPKLERLLRLLMMLSAGYGYSIAEISDKLDTSERTIYRYIETLRSAGFILSKDDNYFKIDRESPYLKNISDLLHFTREESWILNKAILSLDDEIPIKQNLAKKLYTLYDLKGVPYPVVKRENSERIIALIRAMEEKQRVILKAYQSANSSTISDREVEPFTFTLNYGYIWCYECETAKNKLFKTARIAQVINTGQPWLAEQKHRSMPIDIFRISGSKEIQVKLRLSTRAASLLMEEYPQSEEYIQPESDWAYVYEGWVSSFEGVSRFILGLPDDIEVLAPLSLKNHLNDRISGKKF